MSEIVITGDGQVQLGQRSHVGPGVQAIFSKPGQITIGDYCSIGAGVKFVCSGGDVHIGDWTTLHDSCLVLSGHGVSIGEHGWFGQNAILDGSGGLSIGKGVRVGMYSQIWSHVAAGEQIEGCTLFGERPVRIEDDVWLVGSCIVASGVTLGARTIALIGSNITKSFPPNAVIAGIPAALKEGLSFYRYLSMDEKWDLLRGWIFGAAEELSLEVTEPEPGALLKAALKDGAEGKVYFARAAARAIAGRSAEPATTWCSLEDKQYNKTFSAAEQRILKFLAGNKARFYLL